MKSLVKVSIKILNGKSYFLLHILIVEKFSKHYNKVFFLLSKFLSYKT